MTRGCAARRNFDPSVSVLECLDDIERDQWFVFNDENRATGKIRHGRFAGLAPLEYPKPLGRILQVAGITTAYLEFVQRMNESADALSGARLAYLHRRGLRIFDACDAGAVARARQRHTQQKHCEKNDTAHSVAPFKDNRSATGWFLSCLLFT
jgi:hypothetical protein